MDDDGPLRRGPIPKVTRRGQEGVDDPASDIFFAAIEASPIPMVLSDPNRIDNPIVFVNAAFLRMTGYGRSEVLGRNCRFLQGPDTDPDTVDRIRRALASRSEISVELRNHRKDGTSFRNALFIAPVFDTGGQLVYFFASQVDMSHRHEAGRSEDRASATALRDRVGGIAHDFNNLLQVVTGHMGGLKVHAAASGDASLLRKVGAVSEAADRAVALTRRLLALARGEDLDGGAVDRDRLASGTAERPTGVAEDEEAGRPMPGGEDDRGGGRLILVVDDRAEVAALARKMLEDLGYRVEVAQDGQKALAKLTADVALLFSDLVMPGELDGAGLAREAQRLHPRLRILLTTGYADPAGSNGGPFATIAKPYRRADLAKAVRDLLGRPAGAG